MRSTGFAEAFRGPYLWPSVTALAGISIGSVDQYVVNTSMPRVLAELGQPVFYAWVASGFVLAQIVGMALAGAWRDRSGLRTPFLAGIAVFGVGSLLCAGAPSMAMLVVARAFQGLGGGALSALSYAAVAGYPESLRIRMYSLISTLWGIVALGAPLMGGAITDWIGWRWIFLANVPLCLIATAIAVQGLKGSAPADRRRALPVLRSILLALTVGAFIAAPSAEPLVAVALAICGVILGRLYLSEERRAAVPVLPLETWTARGAVGSCMLATMFVTAAYIGSNVFLPLYLQNVRGESAFTAGLVMSSAGVCWTVGSLLGVRAEGVWRMRVMRLGALMIAFGGLSVAAIAAAGNVPLVFVYLTWDVAAIGVGLALLHLMNWVVAYSPPERAGAASAAVQTGRMLGSAAGGALMGAVLHGIGADAGHLWTAISAIFLLGATFALMPATLLRPRLEREHPQEPEARPAEALATVEA